MRSSSSPARSVVEPRVEPRVVRRLIARRRQRGAVVFIVAMTLALLALMGVYAVSGAASEVRSSGYVRQATQAHYLSEYAMGAMANHINSSNADYMVNSLLMGKTPPADCISVPQAGGSAIALACWRFSQEEIERGWRATGASAGPPVLTQYGLGQPGVSTMEGTVVAEFSNPVLTQPPPGYDLNLGLSFARVTVTTGGSVNPVGNTANRTLEIGRARMIIGPVRR